MSSAALQNPPSTSTFRNLYLDFISSTLPKTQRQQPCPNQQRRLLFGPQLANELARRPPVARACLWRILLRLPDGHR
ncbi:hypothetical protein NKR19_g4708 [Coniochaeta hoffmannii]|uniref:Uncharacterized protein n=1 Tax=Coniochaeta hoffmannii TaxID=91930 RepID=A0AA38RMW6_9PEZI|nr:hypothetical protein NKR19_g4708 [Coniochaeta hoffmannii]